MEGELYKLTAPAELLDLWRVFWTFGVAISYHFLGECGKKEKKKEIELERETGNLQDGE